MHHHARPKRQLQGMDAAIELAAPLLHSGDRIKAANVILDALGQPRVNEETAALTMLNTALRWCLDRDRKDLAAKLLWTPTQFTPEPRSVRLIWNAVEKHQFVLLMGASSMGKTYTPGVYLFLEWLRDPEYTLVRAIGPSENHLRDNLFTHLVMLHQNASIPLPGVVQDLFIGLNPKNRKGGLAGTVIPQGKANKGAGRLQGGKRSPRKKAHPVFGKMSRLFILLDEIENIAQGIFVDLNNLTSNIDSDVDGGFKVIGSFNPKEPSAPPARLSCPKSEGGWKDFDVDTDEEWESAAGFHVVRLDAERCENVVSGKTIYPGLQTKAGLLKLEALSGGKTSAGYYTFGRGAYPPQGTDETLFYTALLDARLATPLWVGQTWPVGGSDLALEGGAHAQFCDGTFGMATGVRLPNGHIEAFRDASGAPRARPALYAREINPMPKSDTMPMARSVMNKSLSHRIDPSWLAVDRTGVGSGVHDLLKGMWGPVIGVNYSEGSSDTKILEEDSAPASEMYGRIDSELWIAARRLTEHGFIWFNPAMGARAVLWQQLCGRKYNPSKRDRVESKGEYKSRGNPSPDEADAFTLMVHAMRMTSGSSFSVQRWQQLSADTLRQSGMYDFEGDVSPAIVDPTNRIDSLEFEKDSYERGNW